LSLGFPIRNGLTQGDALSPLLLNFALEYAIKKIQENQVGLKLNGTHQLLYYADDANPLGVNVDVIQKNTERQELVQSVLGQFRTWHLRNAGQNFGSLVTLPR
jgi:hypothetical protein